MKWWSEWTCGKKSWWFTRWRGCCLKMIFDVLTIFPGIFDSPLAESLLKKASDRGLIQVRVRNLRDFADDRHRTTDDYPYGGGAGMVMKPEPVIRAVGHVRGIMGDAKVILMTPPGRGF